MIRVACLTILFLVGFMSSQVQCQQTRRFVSGTAMLADGRFVAGATVTLSDTTGRRIYRFGITKQDGSFMLDASLLTDTCFLLRIEQLTTESYALHLNIPSIAVDIPALRCIMSARTPSLQEVVIKAPALTYRVSGDTTEFNARSYRTVETRKIEDLFRKIDGFQLTEEGRVYFQGKEVDRILLDGDDLTEQNYRILSRNLNAGMVDRVQVIDNYSSDRLMRKVDRTGKVAINLTVDSLFRKKLSGTVSLSTTGRRHLTDMSLVFPGKGVKWLSLLNYNETGVETGRQLSNDRIGETSDPLILSTALPPPMLSPMIIPTPPLDRSYARDNEDASVIQVLSARLGRGRSFRFMAGSGLSGLVRTSAVEQRFNTLAGVQWKLHQFDAQVFDSRESLAAISFSHDRGAKTTGYLSLNMSHGLLRQQFRQSTNGEVLDSLSEDSRQSGYLLQLAGYQSHSSTEQLVWNVSYQVRADHPVQTQWLRTGRFLGYPGIPLTRDIYGQHLDSRNFNGRIDVTLHGKQSVRMWNTGIRVEWSQMRVPLEVTTALVSYIPLDTLLFSDRRIYSRSAMLHVEHHLLKNRRFDWYSTLEAGPALFRVLDTANVGYRAKVLYRVSSGVDHRFSALSGLRISVYRTRKSPDPAWFHPGPLFQADGTVRISAVEVVPETVSGFSASISKFDPSRSLSALLHLSGTYTDGTYNGMVVRTPAYTTIVAASFNGQRMLLATGSLSKYLPSVRCKSVTDASVQVLEAFTSFDGDPVKHQNGRIVLQQRIISAFRIPVNAELSYTGTRNVNALTTGAGVATTFQLWQHTAYLKAVYRSGDRGFISLLYACRSLLKGNLFQTIDFHVRWKASKSVMLSMTGHNLTGARLLALRSVSMNATTDQRVSLVGRYLLCGIEWNL